MSKVLRTTSSLLLTTLALGCAAASPADIDQPSPSGDPPVGEQVAEPSGLERLRFTGAKLSGPGCNQGGNFVYIPDDGSLQVRFGSFATQVNASTVGASTTCIIEAQVAVPPGMEYAVTGFTYSGRATGAPGIQVAPSFTYTFMGTQQPVSTVKPRSPLVLPLEHGEFMVEDQVALVNPVYSGCRSIRPLEIRGLLRVINTSPGQEGEAYLHSASGNVGLVVRAKGRPCEAR